MARHDRSDSESPVKRRESPPQRRRDRDKSPPPRHMSSRRSDSPVRPTSSQKIKSSDRDNPSRRARSPKTASRSPSPRTKRLRRAQDKREEAKLGDRRRGRDEERNGRGGGDLKEKDRVRDKVKSDVRDRGERRSERDADEVPNWKRERRERSSSPLERERRERSSSPLERHPIEKSKSRSHSKDRKRDYDEEKRAGSAEPNGIEDDSFARMKAAEEALAAKKKEEPSFELSGKLADETNRVKGVTLLFNEPPEARKPDIRWRLYVFKAGEMLNEPLYIHRQSCYLFGRERRVADIPTDHPSCSKQHAVIQYRQIEKEQPDGMLKKVTRPYLMDLGSTNGTFINDNRVEAQRYYELIEQDTIKFGNSSREYVILHENSAKGD